MNLELSQDGLCLKPNQFLKVRGGAGYAIVCHAGSVWVTQEGDPRDFLLRAGESVVLERNTVALVQAFEQSAVGVVAPAARARRAAAPLRRALAGARFARGAAGI